MDTVTLVTTRSLQFDKETQTFHGFMSEGMAHLGRIVEVESGRTGARVLFQKVGSHWTPDHEGEPDGYFNYDLYTSEETPCFLKVWNGGPHPDGRFPVDPWGRVLGQTPIIDLRGHVAEVEEFHEDDRDLDPDLVREAHEEMEMEGEVIAREEADLGWNLDAYR